MAPRKSTVGTLAVAIGCIAALIGAGRKLGEHSREDPKQTALLGDGQCTRATGCNFGGWQPTANDVIAASAVATLHCLEHPADAIRHCAESLNSGLVRLSSTLDATDCHPKPSVCIIATRAAVHLARKWVAFYSSDRGVFFDEGGCGTYGFVQVTIVEVTHREPVVYLSRFYRSGYGEHLDCTVDMPADWDYLPLDLRAFLCADAV
jgi:hypothetical protein